jgi:hypothetical protein
MATTQTKTPSFDAAVQQVQDLNEQFVAAARKAGTAYIDSYEKTVDRTINLELKLAGMTQQEWLKSLVEAQADITRELASSYTSVARTVLK